MLLKSDILKRLHEIYSHIPSTISCQHCHFCCGPILWFYPEELNIRDYLLNHNMEYIIWTTDEFLHHDMRCPYLKDDRCSIYPVRPFVCRIQGSFPDLPCRFPQKNQLSYETIDILKQEFEQLLKETHSIGIFYGTRKRD
ncbi:MAG: YkgJ family cysteine cluster protein [Candidatus Thermoplasmatota archaeon]